MKITERIDILAATGKAIKSDIEQNSLEDLLFKVENENPWFVKDFVLYALNNIVENYLDAEKLTEWASRSGVEEVLKPKVIGLIPAGNIPLVGLHDFLAVFLSGNIAKIKPSSKDQSLNNYFLDVLKSFDNSVTKYLFNVERLTDFDAVIATGSNNTHRYFEYYFGKYPNILRKNRTSVAVLSNRISDQELYSLADDVFMYFGLGCRSISKLYLPSGFSVERLLDHFRRYEWLINHNKFQNNYMYQKSVYLVNSVSHFDTNFVLLTENENLHSPIGTLYFENYIDNADLVKKLESIKDDCQIVLSNEPINGYRTIEMGFSQKTTLFDYADGIDTMAFLKTLNTSN